MVLDINVSYCTQKTVTVWLFVIGFFLSLSLIAVYFIIIIFVVHMQCVTGCQQMPRD